MSTPISHSEKLDYRIQHKIFNYAEKMIEHTQSFRSAAFFAIETSSLTSFMLQVFSIGELTIRGLGLISYSDRQLGKAMLKKASIKTLGIPLDVLNLMIGPFVMAFNSNPKFHILYGAEYTKVDLDHAERGTIDSEDHQRESQEAFGRAKKGKKERRESTNPDYQRNNATSISHSERLDYHIQHQIFNYINEITEPGQRLRPPAFLALGVSNTTFLILRVFAVGELTIRGLGLIYSDYPLGKAMLKKVPVQVLQATVGLAASTIVNSYRIIKEPKGYILNNLEQTQIDIHHAEAGTFDSETYQSDLQAARGRAAATLREWQEQLIEHHEL
ncbi:MAG: hypothetical protein ACRDAI_06630 [Candidatus Rhabdochlamydia sp.]